MKRTLNPKDPIKNEIHLCKMDTVTPNSEFHNHDKKVDKVYSNCKYDFINYPDAIPEECFVFFGNQSKQDGLTEKEMLLNMHFMNKHCQVLEQRVEKEVFMANGFTQRNQRGDDQEERLKTEILSDYNEFESINREAEIIMGGSLSVK